MRDLNLILAENVRKYRLEKGLSQTGLAERAGLSTRRIVGLEKAQQSPRISTIEALSRALGIEPWQLLDHKTQKPARPESSGLLGT